MYALIVVINHRIFTRKSSLDMFSNIQLILNICRLNTVWSTAKATTTSCLASIPVHAFISWRWTQKKKWTLGSTWFAKPVASEIQLRMRNQHLKIPLVQLHQLSLHQNPFTPMLYHLHLQCQCLHLRRRSAQRRLKNRQYRRLTFIFPSVFPENLRRSLRRG